MSGNMERTQLLINHCADRFVYIMLKTLYNVTANAMYVNLI